MGQAVRLGALGQGAEQELSRNACMAVLLRVSCRGGGQAGLPGEARAATLPRSTCPVPTVPPVCTTPHLPFRAAVLSLCSVARVLCRGREYIGAPGMVVLQFAWGGGPSNVHLPHNHYNNCFAYTGTHDNETTIGWYRVSRHGLQGWAGGGLRAAGGRGQACAGAGARVSLGPSPVRAMPSCCSRV